MHLSLLEPFGHLLLILTLSILLRDTPTHTHTQRHALLQQIIFSKLQFGLIDSGFLVFALGQVGTWWDGKQDWGSSTATAGEAALPD